MTATGVFGALGMAVGLIRALPQLFRLLRDKDAHGVSVDTAATSSIVSFGWAGYGVLSDQPPVAFATGSSGVIFAGVTILALRFGRRTRELRAAPVWLFVLTIALVSFGSKGLGSLLPISVLVANVPQILAAYREKDLTGLSPATWLLSVSDGLVWFGYSLFARDGSIFVFGVLQVTTSGMIVARRWMWERRHPVVRRDHIVAPTTRP